MKNIFEGAKFGDKFMTRDGKKAIVINLPRHFQDITMALTIEGDEDAFYRFYHEDGTAKKEAGDTDAVDIVSKWKEPIDEEKLDRLYDEYRFNKNSPFSIEEDFKAGYRKAKED